MDIKITTGGLDQAFEVIDAIFATDSNKEGFFSGADPGKAFEGVKKQLRSQCEELGGQAVVNCQFEYRVAVSDGVFGAKQVMEIFAYGTAVKLN